jgi:hypothetical protein
MTFEAVDWNAVGKNSGDDLKKSVFSLLRLASVAINSADPEDPVFSRSFRGLQIS